MMKEKTTLVKSSGGQGFWRKLITSSTFQRVLLHSAYFTAGLISARGVVFGRHAPFGVAAAAGCSRGYLWTMAPRSAVGYLLPGNYIHTGRYLAALLLLTALRWTLGEISFFKRTIFISSRHGLCFSADYRILFGDIKRLSVANMDFIRNGDR